MIIRGSNRLVKWAKKWGYLPKIILSLNWFLSSLIAFASIASTVQFNTRVIKSSLLILQTGTSLNFLRTVERSLDQKPGSSLPPWEAACLIALYHQYSNCSYRVGLSVPSLCPTDMQSSAPLWVPVKNEKSILFFIRETSEKFNGHPQQTNYDSSIRHVL